MFQSLILLVITLVKQLSFIKPPNGFPEVIAQNSPTVSSHAYSWDSREPRELHSTVHKNGFNTSILQGAFDLININATP